MKVVKEGGKYVEEGGLGRNERRKCGAAVMREYGVGGRQEERNAGMYAMEGSEAGKLGGRRA